MIIANAALTLAFLVTVDANVFDTNGMTGISNILSDIADISAAQDDLDAMESRLEMLDGKKNKVESLKNALTDAMDVEGTYALINSFNHENVDCVENTTWETDPRDYCNNRGCKCSDYIENKWCENGGTGSNWQSSWTWLIGTNGKTAQSVCCVCGGAGTQADA